MPTLPKIADAEELKALDISGLNSELTLAQKALEIIHELKKNKYQELITCQNALFEASKKLSQVKIELKELTSNTQKYSERIKTIKILIKGEKV